MNKSYFSCNNFHYCRHLLLLSNLAILNLSGCGVHAGNPTTTKKPNSQSDGGGDKEAEKAPGTLHPAPVVSLKITFFGKEQGSALKFMVKEVVLQGKDENSTNSELKEIRIPPAQQSWSIDAQTQMAIFSIADNARVPFRLFTGLKFEISSAEYTRLQQKTQPLKISSDLLASSFDQKGNKLPGFVLNSEKVNSFEIIMDLSKTLVPDAKSPTPASGPVTTSENVYILKGNPEIKMSNAE
jgi:hypothetical protein